MSKNILTILSILISVSASFANDWSQYRGPNADGISSETGINKNWAAKPPKVLWKIPMTDKGHSVPSVAKGKVYLLDHKDKKDIIKCLNLKTGKEIWKKDYPNQTRQRWGFTRVQPLVDDGLVYVISRKGQVFCLDAITGKEKWQMNFVKDFGGKVPRFGFTASPVADGNDLILCPIGPGAMVIKVDKKTGKEIWRGGGKINIGYSIPTIQEINGEKQYVLANNIGVSGISPQDGKVLWTGKFKTKHGNNIAVPLVFDKNKVFLCAGYNHGSGAFKIDGNKCTKLWENGNLKAHFNSPILVDKSVYGIGDPGKLTCMDPVTGNVRWEQRGFGKGGIIIIDGTIIAIDGNTGAVVQLKLDPTKYTEMGRITPLSKDKQSWVPPVISDKKLLVRNRKELICLDISNN